MAEGLFIPPQLFFNVLQTACLLALIAISIRIPYLVTGFFDLSHALSILAGGYLAFTVLELLGWSIWPALGVAVFGASFLSLSLHQGIYITGRRLGAEKWQLLIMSLGVFAVGQSAIALVWGREVQVSRVWQDLDLYQFGSAYVTVGQISVILVSITALVLLAALFAYTKIGREIILVSDNKDLAEIFGVNVARIEKSAILIGGGLAGLAGCLLFQDIGIAPANGFAWLLNGMAAMIVSGLGSARYLLFGCLILALVQNYTAFAIDPRWTQSITFIIIVFVLVVKPYGLSGRKIRKLQV